VDAGGGQVLNGADPHSRWSRQGSASTGPTSAPASSTSMWAR